MNTAHCFQSVLSAERHHAGAPPEAVVAEDAGEVVETQRVLEIRRQRQEIPVLGLLFVERAGNEAVVVAGFGQPELLRETRVLLVVGAEADRVLIVKGLAGPAVAGKLGVNAEVVVEIRGVGGALVDIKRVALEIAGVRHDDRTTRSGPRRSATAAATCRHACP